MRQPYELSIALRYLRTRSTHSFISFISAVSMIGIALAVAVLIVVLSVMNGFEHELQQRILGMVSDATIIGLRRAALRTGAEVRERVLERDDIDAAAPYVEGQAHGGSGRVGRRRHSARRRPELEREVSTIGRSCTSGDFGALTSGTATAS